MSRAIDTLADNISSLFASRTGPTTAYQLAKKSGVSASTMSRVMNREVAAGVDTVEAVARAFRVRACDLLDPALARRLQDGQDPRLTEPRPPVVADADWRALSPRVRAFVEDVCQRSIAGSLDDATVGWLHDAMQRMAPK